MDFTKIEHATSLKGEEVAILLKNGRGVFGTLQEIAEDYLIVDYPGLEKPIVVDASDVSVLSTALQHDDDDDGEDDYEGPNGPVSLKELSTILKEGGVLWKDPVTAD